MSHSPTVKPFNGAGVWHGPEWDLEPGDTVRVMHVKNSGYVKPMPRAGDVGTVTGFFEMTDADGEKDVYVRVRLWRIGELKSFLVEELEKINA